MFDISAYRLTIVAAIVVLILSAALLTALNGVTNTSAYLAFLGPTIVALLAVLRGEQNAKQSNEQHSENRAALSKLVVDNAALGEALRQVKIDDPKMRDVAHVTADVLANVPPAALTEPPDPSVGGQHT